MNIKKINEKEAMLNDRYLITNEGTVFRNKNGKYIEQAKRKHTNGYLRATIDGKDEYIHRLVALCFIDNPNDYKEVNHKDGNKENNKVDNLEWCTRSQNNKHAFQTGLRSYDSLSAIAKMPKYKARKFTEEQLAQIREMIKEGMTDSKISEKVNGTRGSIYQIRIGKTYKQEVQNEQRVKNSIN